MDAITEWTNTQRRVVELAESLNAEEAERSVPACPDWTVTQLLAHMVGLNADVLAGDEPDDHNRAWTQRQVDRRSGREPADLVAEWLAQAQADAAQPNPNSMVVATVDGRGYPSARVVLCKEIEVKPGRVVFYTNYRSRKGQELETNRRAAVVFHSGSYLAENSISGMRVPAVR